MDSGFKAFLKVFGIFPELSARVAEMHATNVWIHTFDHNNARMIIVIPPSLSGFHIRLPLNMLWRTHSPTHITPEVPVRYELKGVNHVYNILSSVGVSKKT